MATIVHFEIPADDIERAKAFYTQLFDWKIEKHDGPKDYWMISTTDTKGEKGLEGGIIQRQDPQHPITNYVEVDSVDEYAAKVESLNGVIIVPKMPVTGVGYFAVCEDTENNVFGIWETDPDAFALPPLEDPAEVFIALQIAVIAADENYSVDEMRMIWYEIETMEIFKDKDFKALEAKMFKAFNKKPSEPAAFQNFEIDWIIKCANEKLSAAQRQAAFDMATKLAHADKNIEGYQKDMDRREIVVLNRLQEGLEI